MMSPMLVPRYEYCDAGEEAMPSSVDTCAPPKPTAKIFTPSDLMSSAVEIAADEPPYREFCSPSVSSMISLCGGEPSYEPSRSDAAFSPALMFVAPLAGPSARPTMHACESTC